MTRRIAPPAIVRHHQHRLGALTRKAGEAVAIDTFVTYCRTELYASVLKHGSLIVSAQLASDTTQVDEPVEEARERHSLNTNHKTHLVVEVIFGGGIHRNGRVKYIVI